LVELASRIGCIDKGAILGVLGVHRILGESNVVRTMNLLGMASVDLFEMNLDVFAIDTKHWRWERRRRAITEVASARMLIDLEKAALTSIRR